MFLNLNGLFVLGVVSRVSTLKERDSKTSFQSALASFQHTALALYAKRNNVLNALRPEETS